MSTDNEEQPSEPTTRKTVQTARDEIGAEISAIDNMIADHEATKLTVQSELSGLRLAKKSFLAVLEKLK